MIDRIKILILVLGVFTLSGCDDFFDTVPDSRIELDDIDDVAELVTNAYPAGSYLFLEGMTDNVGAVPSNIQLTQMEEAYNWQTISMEGQDTPSYFWANAYNAIAHANQALKSIEKMDGDKAKKDAVKGEALLCRAYSHFMLVNMFGKHYDPTTATSDLGVPYIKEPEMTLLVSYNRETVEKTYDYIEEDMLEGLSLVSNDYYKNTGKYHFNREAALAFASRYYLYKGDYGQCLHFSKQLLGNTYNEAYVRDYKAVLAGQGPKGRAQVFSNPEDPSNLLIIRKKLGYQLYFQFGYRMTQNIASRLYLGDSRSLNMWGANADQSAVYQSKYESLVKRASLTSNSGLPYTVQPVLRGEEVMFNMMESLMALGDLETNLEEQKLMDHQAASFFNNFLVERWNGPKTAPALSDPDTYFFDEFIGAYRRVYPDLYPDYTRNKAYNKFLADGSLNPDFDQVIKDEMDEKIRLDNRVILSLLIQLERRREFAEEGLRWFDIKRLKLEVIHQNVSGVTDILKADDPRKVLQIPQAAISTGIEENPIETPAPVAEKLVRL
ncbi:RagB/SusD family nutrient uptake outer membrane protein [Ancylomarina euxinus]|uniref:RagB/SusD family nutrient uptake outer membrane protein n=1 Tax=Ancylomarina euxinus TaxID=2283627 RepID=A0A425XY51_9BACT|nr:RagB/SusD family nutrient uptake outer membrane protein [Ancylomarina euxinus]MCZ4695947.1 RagB/SusD family nutrient uptake outer membrane protein [Ancylomarina euxinus]MUP16319.1 RagB/SusD family nutrient uptake outer membrane protein [Ancylomarina euxinus]RRG19715.1 RagB/SusD family nutrient uptake outer membrane protein [Ancylomarina euxinus]